MDTLTYTTERRGLLLAPRTKLLMLITVTSLMLSTGNSGVMNIVKPVLSVLPFVLLLTEGRWKTSLQYLGLYAVCFALERAALYCLSGLPAFLLLTVCSIMTRFAPGIMMGAFLIASTSVSDLIAAMKRMHISEKIIIPMPVIFRFFPTIGEENAAINDAMAILEQLDLTPFLERHPASLSGGQKQRLAIASAMAAQRSVLFFDEPTSGLDYRHMLQTARLFLQLRQNGRAVYVVTHDPELICACCTDVIHMEAGRIRECYPLNAAGVDKIRHFFRIDGALRG